MKPKSSIIKSLPLLHITTKTTITLQAKLLTYYLPYNPTITIAKIPKITTPIVSSQSKIKNKLMRNFVFKISNELKKKNLLNLNKK